MKIVDLHEDFGITASQENVFTESVQNSIQNISNFEDTLIFAVTFPFRKTWTRISPELDHFKEKLEFAWVPDLSSLYTQAGFYAYLERTNSVQICKTRSQLGLPGPKFLMSIEGCDPIPDYSDAYLLHDLGYRCVGLTWNHDNKYAASCLSKKDYGLTGSGEDLIGLCNKLGMVIDMAHSSPKSLVEAAQISSAPIIVTHSNVRALQDHKRSLTDEGIAAVADSKGVIGISGIGDMLGSKPTIHDVVEHIKYIGDNYGWEYVALGSDFLGMIAKTEGFVKFNDILELEKLLEKPDLVLYKNVERVLNKIMK